ncbi:Hypothetical predicted protein [Octopus vulgaris]|uniref:Uncharacterized protein n=1 Tax=Octopus vulgaris TaxID=6645 RepID=A0AA36B268_OCTVU|nr:Hypothetical predicted protein [Octopus vulgaris]
MSEMYTREMYKERERINIGTFNVGSRKQKIVAEVFDYNLLRYALSCINGVNGIVGVADAAEAAGVVAMAGVAAVTDADDIAGLAVGTGVDAHVGVGDFPRLLVLAVLVDDDDIVSVVGAAFDTGRCRFSCSC